MTAIHPRRRYRTLSMRLTGLVAATGLSTALTAAAQDPRFAVLNDQQAAAAGMRPTWGVIVSAVAPGGPAALGGMRVRDVIVGVDGYRVTSLGALLRYFSASRMGGGELTFVMFCPHREETYVVVARMTPHRVMPRSNVPAAPGMGTTNLPPVNVPSYVNDYNKIVADAQQLQREAERTVGQLGISQNPVQGAADFGNLIVGRARQDSNDMIRLSQECARGVPGGCERANQLAQRQQEQANRLGMVTTVQGAYNAAAQIGSSVNRQNQERSYADQKRQALSQADSYQREAEAALQAGRYDVADSYFAKATHLRNSVGGYK